MATYIVLTAFLLQMIASTSAQVDCGRDANNALCANNQCCSQYGYCGTTDAYCGIGCQSQCPTSGGAQCGTQANNKKCPNNLCCSQYGYCGDTSSYCGTPGCQSQCAPTAPKGVFPGHLLFDYIGANGVAINFNDVPTALAGVDYALGLSFAIDMNANGATQNGVHTAYWNPTLSPAAAKAWRQAQPNRRILIAIGGYELYSNGQQYRVVWYDPPNPNQWLANAVSSLTTLVQSYGADGIDIDIENFPNGSANFVSLIGSLITTLKNNGVISIVSVAPGYDQLPLYTQLYQSYGNYIDLINYQFYGDQGLDTCAKYTARFNQIIATLPVNKVGLSTQVSQQTNCISGQTFVNCVQSIKSANNIAGVFLWSADLSKRDLNFSTETALAPILNST